VKSKRWWDDPLAAAQFRRLEERRAPRAEDLRAWYIERGWVTPEEVNGAGSL